jgi:hypothetical protein
MRSGSCSSIPSRRELEAENSILPFYKTRYRNKKARMPSRRIVDRTGHAYASYLNVQIVVDIVDRVPGAAVPSGIEFRITGQHQRRQLFRSLRLPVRGIPIACSSRSCLLCCCCCCTARGGDDAMVVSPRGAGRICRSGRGRIQLLLFLQTINKRKHNVLETHNKERERAAKNSERGGGRRELLDFYP